MSGFLRWAGGDDQCYWLTAFLAAHDAQALMRRLIATIRRDDGSDTDAADRERRRPAGCSSDTCLAVDNRGLSGDGGAVAQGALAQPAAVAAVRDRRGVAAACLTT